MLELITVFFLWVNRGNMIKYSFTLLRSMCVSPSSRVTEVIPHLSASAHRVVRPWHLPWPSCTFAVIVVSSCCCICICTRPLYVEHPRDEWSDEQPLPASPGSPGCQLAWAFTTASKIWLPLASILYSMPASLPWTSCLVWSPVCCCCRESIDAIEIDCCNQQRHVDVLFTDITSSVSKTCSVVIQ